MKSNVPWSVKGIDPEARVVAKAAAREAGMTLGEWMNQAIREVGEGRDGDAAGGGANEAQSRADTPLAAASGVTTDQLRAVVDSLNRLNDRLNTQEESLKTQEAQTRQTAAGLGQGLETVYERMKRLERERREGAPEAIAERVEKLERGEGDKGRIDGLKRLESALTSMVEALEITRTEAITKIAENEEAVQSLASRVDVLDDKLSAGFAEVHSAIDAVGEHLERTERTAGAVLSDAKEASGSTDAEFVAATSRRLQVLGNEIKRSGDQIRAVEEMVGRLSAKIEAAEHRSAEGIGEVAASLEDLRAGMTTQSGHPGGGGADAASSAKETIVAEDELADAAREADKKVSRLQRSYDAMMARLEGGAADAASANAEGDAAAGKAGAGATEAASGDAAGDAETPLVGEAPEAIVPPAVDSRDFDEIFPDDVETVAAPTAPTAAVDGPEGLRADDPSAPPPMLGGAMPLAAGVGIAAGAGAVLTQALPGEQGASGQAAADADGEADGKAEIGKLTARQKVLLAARARKKRLAAERDADSAGAGGEAADAASGATPGAPSGAPSIDGAPYADEKLLADGAGDDLTGSDVYADLPTAGTADADDGQNRKLGVGLFALLALLVGAMAFAGYTFFGKGGDEAGPTATAEPIGSGAERLPDANAPAALPTVTANASLLYDQGLDLLAQGQEAESFRLFQRAADEGFVPARFRVGHAYYDGLGVPKNMARARTVFLDAAMDGNVLAMHYLGNLSASDPAEPPNIPAALDWFERAASHGVIASAYNLGYLYDPTADDGLMPADQRDAARAYYWYSVAAGLGDGPARDEADLVAGRLTPEKVAEIDAQVAAWTPLPVSESANDGIRLPG